ncbi:MAG TPA: tripartite tricarboxylate transporter TctB family protein [Kiloniellaceae bacterium]
MGSFDKRDLAAGLALVAVGVAFAFGSLELRIGSARQMGAGYFPLIFSAVTIVAGVLVAVAALFRSGALVVPPWRPFAAVCASIAVFIVSLSQAGLVPAVVFAVWVAALADRRSTKRGALVLSAGVAAACWLIFVVVLNLPIPLIRVPF